MHRARTHMYEGEGREATITPQGEPRGAHARTNANHPLPIGGSGLDSHTGIGPKGNNTQEWPQIANLFSYLLSTIQVWGKHHSTANKPQHSLTQGIHR